MARSRGFEIVRAAAYTAARMRVVLPHRGSQADGIVQLKAMLTQHRAQINQHASDLKEEWNDNVLTFAFTSQGTHIQGTLTVRDKEYELVAKLPLTMRLFEGTIERMIAAEVKKLGL
jgi:hypothetical protein